MSAMMTLSSAAAQIPFFQIPTAQQQESSSSVLGIVQDRTTAVLPRAVIELTRNATGKKLQVTTDESGKFLVKGLNTGLYDIKIQVAGFRTFSRQISLANREEFSLTATLDVGEVNMGVIVTAEAPKKKRH